MPKQQRLTMEEKRHLQKLLFTDITSAEAAYKARRSTERSDLNDKLADTPPPHILALFAQWTEAHTAMEAHAEALLQVGYRVLTYRDPPCLAADNPQELAAFDTETERTGERFAALKRDYTLRLFAGGEEARALFATLAQDIGAIR